MSLSITSILLSSVLLLTQLSASISSGIDLFDAWVEMRMQSRDIPGAVCAIVHKDQVIWSKAYGGLEKNALFPVGSLTKPFTAIGILKLWQQGDLEIESPIQTILPNFKVGGYESEKSPITVRQLLNHTSGLPQDPDVPFYNDFVFPNFQTISQKLATQSLLFTPGTRWKYSNSGYALLGKIIESVSGMSYEEYLKTNVLMPMGMYKTVFVPENSSDGFLARSTTKERKKIAPYDAKGLRAAMGAFATCDEYARLLSFFMGRVAPKSILSAPTKHFMLTSTVPVEHNVRFGLGVAIRRLSQLLLIEHASQLPGYSTYFSIDPFQQCGVLIFCNTQENLLPWADTFVRWVSAAISDAGSKVNTPEEWQKYLGRYSGPFGDLFVLLHQGKLVLYEPLDSDMLDILVPDGTSGQFRIRDGYTFSGSAGDSVSFQVDPSGKLKSMKIANMYLYPL